VTLEPLEEMIDLFKHYLSEYHLWIVIVLIVAYIVIKLLHKVINRFYKRGRVSYAVAQELSTIVTLIVSVFAILYIASRVALSPLSIVIIIAVIAMAIVLLYDVIANFIAYYTITLSRIVREDDVVTIYTEEGYIHGTVQRITHTHTILKTAFGELVTLPNRKVAWSSRIVRHPQHVLLFSVRVEGERIDVEKTLTYIGQAIARCRLILHQEGWRIKPVKFSKDSLEVMLSIQIANPRNSDEVFIQIARYVTEELYPLKVMVSRVFG